MPSRKRNHRDEVKRRSRATKEQTDDQGIGEPEQGVRLPVPSYAENDQTSFLGVDEPTVLPDERGTLPPPTILPRSQDK
jgi:hypothetical protein